MLYNQVIHADSAGEAFDQWWKMLMDHAAEQGTAHSRDGAVAAEIINATTVLSDATRGVCLSPIRKMPMRYAVGELMWYLSGNKNLRAIQHYTDAWDRMSDDGETVNSNYGNRIFDHYGYNQWERNKLKLMENPNDRQCVFHIKDGFEIQPTKDTPCTVALQYVIRDGKLHTTTFMRSNDIWMGFPYDVFAFTSLQTKMAFELGIDVGTYTHHATSLHLYERDRLAYADKQTAKSGAEGGLANAT